MKKTYIIYMLYMIYGIHIMKLLEIIMLLFETEKMFSPNLKTFSQRRYKDGKFVHGKVFINYL